MRKSYLFMTLAAASLFAACTKVDNYEMEVTTPDTSIQQDGQMIELGEDFMIGSRMDMSSIDRSQWGQEGSTVSFSILPMINGGNDMIGGNAKAIAPRVGLGLISGDEILTNYEFVHNGWMFAGETAGLDTDAPCNPGLVMNGVLYEQKEIIAKQDGKTTIYSPFITDGTAAGSDGQVLIDKTNVTPGLDIKGQPIAVKDVDLNSGIYVTHNKSIFTGDYIMYYPYDNTITDRSQVKALAPTEFADMEFLAGEAGKLEALSKSVVGNNTFMVGCGKVQGGSVATNFTMYPVAGLFDIRIVADAAWTCAENVNKILLVSSDNTQKFIAEGTIAASKIAAADGKMTGADFFTSTDRVESIQIGVVPTALTAGQTYHLIIPMLPTNIQGMQAILFFENGQTARLDLTPSAESMNAGAASFGKATLADADLKNAYYVTDQESLTIAVDKAKVASATEEVTIEVLRTFPLTKATAIESNGKLVKVITNNQAKLQVNNAKNFLTIGNDVQVGEVDAPMDIEVLGADCCVDSLKAGKLVVNKATIYGDVIFGDPEDEAKTIGSMEVTGGKFYGDITGYADVTTKGGEGTDLTEFNGNVNLLTEDGTLGGRFSLTPGTGKVAFGKVLSTAGDRQGNLAAGNIRIMKNVVIEIPGTTTSLSSILMDNVANAQFNGDVEAVNIKANNAQMATFKANVTTEEALTIQGSRNIQILGNANVGTDLSVTFNSDKIYFGGETVKVGNDLNLLSGAKELAFEGTTEVLGDITVGAANKVTFNNLSHKAGLANILAGDTTDPKEQTEVIINGQYTNGAKLFIEAAPSNDKKDARLYIAKDATMTNNGEMTIEGLFDNRGTTTNNNVIVDRIGARVYGNKVNTENGEYISEVDNENVRLQEALTSKATTTLRFIGIGSDYNVILKQNDLNSCGNLRNVEIAVEPVSTVTFKVENGEGIDFGPAADNLANLKVKTGNLALYISSDDSTPSKNMYMSYFNAKDVIVENGTRLVIVKGATAVQYGIHMIVNSIKQDGSFNIPANFVLKVNNDFLVTGNTNFGQHSNVMVLGNLMLTGDYDYRFESGISSAKATNLYVVKNMEMSGAGLKSFGDYCNVGVDGNLKMLGEGNQTIGQHSVISVIGDMFMNGNADQTIAANSELTVEGAMQMNGNGAQWINDNTVINVTKDMQINGKGDLNVTADCELTVGGNLQVNGEAAQSFGANTVISVTGNMEMNGKGDLNVLTACALNVGGNLQVNGEAAQSFGANTKITVTGNMEMNGAGKQTLGDATILNIDGNLDMKGGAVQEVKSKSLTVGGNYTVQSTGKTTFYSTLQTLNVANLMKVASEAEIMKDVKFEVGAMTFDSNVVIGKSVMGTIHGAFIQNASSNTHIANLTEITCEGDILTDATARVYLATSSSSEIGARVWYTTVDQLGADINDTTWPTGLPSQR